MSNPSLPPLPEPNWPLAELVELARAAGALLDASRVWIALRDRHGDIVPQIALKSVGDRFEPTDPGALHDFVGSVIRSLTGRGATSTPVGIADLHARREIVEQAGPEAHLTRSLAAVALLNESAILGALIVTSAQIEALTERRRQILSSLAHQAVTTIRLTFAAESNAAQANELNAILVASQALTSTLKSEEVFSGIIHSIQGVITCDRALIYRYDEHAGVLRIITSLGEGTEGLAGAQIPLDDPDSKAAWVARNGRSFSGMIGPSDDIGAQTNKLTDGKNVWLLCMPLMSKGRLRGVASLARDTGFTQRDLRALARLSPIAAAALENVDLYGAEHVARQQQEAIFESASDGFALVDDQLRLIQVNAAFARYVAADPDALLGQVACSVFASLMPAQTGSTCLLCTGSGHERCLLRESISNGVSFDHVECAFPIPVITDQAHGSVGPRPVGREIDFSLTPVSGPGQRARVLMVGRDISAAREVDRVRAQFVNMTTHELAGPLHTVAGQLDMFLRVYQRAMTPEQLSGLKAALAAANSMELVIEDLDVLSKRDAGQWVIEQRPADLAGETQAAIEEMRFDADKKGVRLIALQQPPNLPLAWMDKRRARQVARNLITNAIKYTPAGGSVTVGLSADAQWVRLHVSDTGIGIPQSEQELIWQRYHRASKPEGAENAPGQGLGLAIVRIIVDAHNGLREVQSEVGQGTTFTISFPRADRMARR
ncbi:MAG TPA: ATP-binding protein [Ktedonobacterales bacterium]